MKKNRKIGPVGQFIFVLLISWAPATVHAELTDILSRFQVSMAVQEDYTDNIDLTHKHRLSDFITTLYPGLRFTTLSKSEVTGQYREPSSTAAERFGIDLDYRPGIVFYADHSDRNYVSHDGSLHTWFSPNRAVTFRIKDYLKRSEEPLEREFAEGALENQYLLGTQRNRAIYLRNVLEPSLEYRFGKEDLFSIYFRDNIYDTESTPSRDSHEDYINPHLSYWFDIRNGVSLDYALTLGQFDEAPDLVGHMAKGRYTRRLSPVTSFFGEYTFLTREFDKVRFMIFPGIELEAPSRDYVTHNPSVGIEHVFSRSFSGRGQIGYFWQIPKTGPGRSGPSYDISLTKRVENTSWVLSLQGGYREDFFTAENLGFAESHRAIGTVSHRLGERVTVGFSGSFERAETGDDRKDNIWGVNGSFSYQPLKWLVLSLSYSHRENHSNISIESYKENRGVFKITATYL